MATQVFKIPDSFKKDAKYTFCPGCDHGVAVRLVGECLSELGLTENAIAACSIGCSVTIYDFLNVDSLEAPHGRALAEATGIKRACPDKFVFTYQGDGDFASRSIRTNYTFRTGYYYISYRQKSGVLRLSDKNCGTHCFM